MYHRKPLYTKMFSCPQERIDQIQLYHEIQGSHGNWDVDDYNLGLFNGIEMCLAALEGREPDFRVVGDQPFAFDEEGNLPNLQPEITPVFDFEVPEDPEGHCDPVGATGERGNIPMEV